MTPQSSSPFLCMSTAETLAPHLVTVEGQVQLRARDCRKTKVPWLSEQYGFSVSAMTVVCLGNCGCCFSWGWSNISFQIECPTASHLFVAQMYWRPHCWKLPSFMFTCMMQAFCHFYLGIFVVLSNSSKGPLCSLFLSDTFLCRMVFE